MSNELLSKIASTSNDSEFYGAFKNAAARCGLPYPNQYQQRVAAASRKGFFSEELLRVIYALLLNDPLCVELEEILEDYSA